MNIIATEDCISISIRHAALVASVAEADRMSPGVWWIARVKVADDHQRRGVGRRLVEALLTSCASAGNLREVQVVPGGYNMKPEEQRAFYAACGFVPEGDDGLMVWRPKRRR